ncbi:MAG: hypothetical protein RML12_09670 [Xanthomonadales bacterium]|nr:hypothetical protein [Xanthomonadales bacterium]
MRIRRLDARRCFAQTSCALALAIPASGLAQTPVTQPAGLLTNPANTLVSDPAAADQWLRRNVRFGRGGRHRGELPARRQRLDVHGDSAPRTPATSARRTPSTTPRRPSAGSPISGRSATSGTATARA